jgi:hypothetical protein
MAPIWWTMIGGDQFFSHFQIIGDRTTRRPLWDLYHRPFLNSMFAVTSGCEKVESVAYAAFNLEMRRCSSPRSVWPGDGRIGVGVTGRIFLRLRELPVPSTPFGAFCTLGCTVSLGRVDPPRWDAMESLRMGGPLGEARPPRWVAAPTHGSPRTAPRVETAPQW